MKTPIMDGTCEACRGDLQEVDSSGHSQTLQCEQCRCCALRITRPDFRVTIPLSDFHLKRGPGGDQRSRDDLRMAESLVESLLLDEWPSPATALDYGIDSVEHLGALQYAVRSGLTAYDLDRVMGDGAAIMRLVRSVPGQPYRDARFMTVYDAAAWEEELLTSAERIAIARCDIEELD